MSITSNTMKIISSTVDAEKWTNWITSSIVNCNVFQLLLRKAFFYCSPIVSDGEFQVTCETLNCGRFALQIAFTAARNSADMSWADGDAKRRRARAVRRRRPALKRKTKKGTHIKRRSPYYESRSVIEWRGTFARQSELAQIELLKRSQARRRGGPSFAAAPLQAPSDAGRLYGRTGQAVTLPPLA